MELNYRTVLVGFLYHFTRIQITGALFFGLSIERSHPSYSYHHPSQKQLTPGSLGSFDKRKRFFEYNPLAFRQKDDDFKTGRNIKRFFHFSPFITSIGDDRKQWAQKVKPKHAHRELFIDHFTGILPSSLHTTNKKFTDENSNSNDIVGQRGYYFEESEARREPVHDQIEHTSENAFQNQDEHLFDTYSEVAPMEADIEKLEQADIFQATPPAVSDSKLDTIPFEWLKENIAGNGNKQPSPNSETMILDSLGDSGFLDENVDTDKDAIEWLTSQSGLNPTTGPNIFYQQKSKVDMNEPDFGFINAARIFDDQDPFKSVNDEIEFGTIEQRNHDSSHSDLDTFNNFFEVPEPSEFAISNSIEPQLTEDQLFDSFLQRFNGKHEKSVDEDDDPTFHLSSRTNDLGTFLQRNELTNSNTETETFSSDNVSMIFYQLFYH